MLDLKLFKNPPYSHQAECLEKFGDFPAFMLAAEMGTGKTFMMINNIADLWRREKINGVLILAPNGVHDNWTGIEIERHMPSIVKYRAAAWYADCRVAQKNAITHMMEAPQDELALFAVNWDALQSARGVDIARKFLVSRRKGAMIIADESDAIKNPSAIRCKKLMKDLGPLSKYRRTLTGTPINNSPWDLFSQYKFLDAGILPNTSFSSFKAEYGVLHPPNSPLVKSVVAKQVRMGPEANEKVRKDILSLGHILGANGRPELIAKCDAIYDAYSDSDWEQVSEDVGALLNSFNPAITNPKKRFAEEICKSIIGMCGVFLKNFAAACAPGRGPAILCKDKNGHPRYQRLEQLSDIIAPYTYRILKKDCLDLPEKIYKNAFFSMTSKQQDIYDTMVDELRLEFKGVWTAVSKLNATTKLSQITSGYYIHPESEEPVDIPGFNPKLELLCDRVAVIVGSGAKVIVWAKYRKEIQDIADILAPIPGAVIVQYHGGVQKHLRADIIDQFENQDANIFIGNQQAAGRGITLVSCHNVIYFSNSFSYSNRAQSEDRAHRIGQRYDVMFYNLLARNSIDEYIIKALDFKMNLAASVMDPVELLDAVENVDLPWS